MKKKFLIAFFVLFVSSALFALAPDLSVFRAAVAADDEDEDEDPSEEGESEEDPFSDSKKKEKDPFAEPKKTEKDPFAEPKKEKDPFAEPKKEKDDFVQSSSRSSYADSEEDDFVVEEKREKGVVHKHKEPDLAKVISSTYLYSGASLKSKKRMELYEDDDLVVLEETEEFYKVEFLGKEGWVPSKAVRLEKWRTYRIAIELSGGIAGGGGDFKNFDIIGNYSLKLNIGVLDDLVVGAEGRALSLDADNLYGGGGVFIRYYIPVLRTRKTRSAITASAGFLGGVEKIADRTRPNGTLSFFGGPYVSIDLEYFFRVWEYIALGVGGDFTYLKMFGSFRGFDRSEQLFQGGAHLSVMFNVMR